MSIRKMTFSLASLILILGLVFVAVPAMAHDLVDAEDGLQHVAGTTLTQAAHDAEHKAAPTVTSVELVDLMVGGNSTVRGSSVVLVADADADPLALRALTANTSGEFQIKVTFSEPVYTDIAPTTTAASGDLEIGDLTVTAASQAASGINLFGAGVNITNNDIVRAADVTTTANVDESLYTFIITVTVTAELIGDSDAEPVVPGQLPVDVWLTVNADVLSSLTGLVNGTNTFGTGNTASDRAKFTVVKMLTPAPTAPAKPDAPTAAIDDDNDLIINVSWMAPAANRSDITGYTVKKYAYPSGTLVKTFPETGTLTDTMLAVGPVPEADRGRSFTFTVMATNSVGDSMESDKSAAVRVPSEAPFFPAGSSIADIKIWAGHPWTSPVLPKARALEGVDYLYKVRPKPATGSGAGSAHSLPGGFELVNDDVEDRRLVISAADKADSVAMAKTTYQYVAYEIDDPMNESDPVEFSIEVVAQKVPTKPTMVMAAEEGAMPANPAARTINNNHVIVNWVAPVDTTLSTFSAPHDTIPFGSPVTGYKVYQTSPAGTAAKTYPADDPNTTAIAATETSYKTPQLAATRNNASPFGRLGVYDFEVTAMNGVGEGPRSDKSADSKAEVLNPPDQPRDLRATKGDTDGGVTLNWLLPTDEGDHNKGTDNNLINDYLVILSHPETGAELSKDQTGDIDVGSDGVIQYALEDLENGRYVPRVSAINRDGVGHASVGTAFSVDVPAPPTVGPNTAPAFADNAAIASIVATVGEQVPGRFLPEATDADDGDTLTYSVTPALPTGLTFNPVNRALTGTPTVVSAETPYTYTVSDGNGGSDTIGFFVTVKSATAGPPATSTPTASLPANGYIVYIRDLNNRPNFGTSNPMVAEWAAMPNLYELFTQGGGGSLQLNVSGVNARQVVFSEVMWAVDEGKVGQDSYDGQQWVELRNRTANAIPITSISFATKSARPALAQGTDLISNVVGAGDAWIRTKGQNGNSGAADGSGQKEFISMYRNNLGEPGWQSSRWTTSTQVYHPNHKGTPGVGEAVGPKIIGTTNVPRSPIIFNEISNNSNPNHEWIELKNVSGGNVNLKNYEVTMITAIGTDVDLIDFTGADRNVPAGGILLVVKKDPTGDSSHPLAAGWNFGARNNWTVAKPGEAHYVPGVNADSPRYMVAAKFDALPDHGEFVLVLRNRQDRNGSTGDANIRDIAGHMPGTRLKVDDANSFTNLWPLSNFHNANAEQNKFTAGTVHRRQHAGVNGTDRSRRDRGNNADDGAFRDHGWTSVGYKRNATPSAQNGGTPGYAANVLRSNDNDANSAVIISEIMPTKGDRNLPEWIELRNTSRTIGVNVNNWRVTITNHDSDGTEGGTYDGDLTRTITLNGQIPPGQTYLIVARNGRNTTNLPNGRIKNVGITRTQTLLNTYGFEIKVESKKDNNYLHVDTAGNLGAAVGRRSRSFADIRWEWPASTDASGDRISIVRVPLNKVPNADGTAQDAWKSFDGTNQADSTDEATYYGHQDDLGSPGHIAGGVLPVSLSKFRPERLKDTGEIVIRWTTESELNNAGFNILRGEALDGEFTKINTSLIAGKGTTSERSSYTYTDKSAKPNVIYYYQIQDVSLDGEVTTLRTTHLRGNVTAVGKATTTWGKIKALQ